MSASSVRRRLAWIVGGPLAGALIAMGVALAVGPPRGERIAGYALGSLPLTVILWSVAERLARGQPASARIGSAGAVIAVGAAKVAALVAAIIRFRQAGARGAIALATLPYTEELLMVVAVAPALLALGFGAASRWADRGVAVSLAAAAGAGVVGFLAIGPALIATSLVGRVGILDPIVGALVLAGVVAWVGSRSGR